jgi:hypothetical protein
MASCCCSASNHTADSLQAAFDPRVLSAVCFFATDIHSATLGRGEQDDSLERVRAGDLTNKSELVVRFPLPFAHYATTDSAAPRWFLENR